MSGRGILYKTSIKISQLCLVLVPTFKEFVELSLNSAIPKSAVTNKTLVKTNISIEPFPTIKTTKTTGTKLFDPKMPIWISDFVTYIVLTKKLTHYPKYQIYTI